MGFSFCSLAARDYIARVTSTRGKLAEAKYTEASAFFFLFPSRYNDAMGEVRFFSAIVNFIFIEKCVRYAVKQ